LIPIVNGKEETFAARGLHNGLVLLGDYTTNSYWDHITGECVHGELKGEQLQFTDYDLLYTTVEAALQITPATQIALSNQLPVQGRFMRFFTPIAHKILGNRLPPHFVRTVGEADTRRTTMDAGLGLWTDATRRYYPMDVLRVRHDGILDIIDDKTVFVYYNDIAKAPDAIYINANAVKVHDDGYLFDTGIYLTNGSLYDSQGRVIAAERPQQMFTRWYGFSYTFPECEIHKG